MRNSVVPEPPEFPAGPFMPPGVYDNRQREGWVDEILRAPARLSQLVAGLSGEQLDTTYRNWTIRQLVHHLADSHLNMYVRFKLALTEEQPTIKPYDESRWSLLADARQMDIAPSLQIFSGLHARWTHLLQSLEPRAFERSFYHPANQEVMPLWRALAYYAWHANHHMTQIEWVKTHKLQLSKGAGKRVSVRQVRDHPATTRSS